MRCNNPTAANSVQASELHYFDRHGNWVPVPAGGLVSDPNNNGNPPNEIAPNLNDNDTVDEMAGFQQGRPRRLRFRRRQCASFDPVQLGHRQRRAGAGPGRLDHRGKQRWRQLHHVGCASWCDDPERPPAHGTTATAAAMLEHSTFVISSPNITAIPSTSQVVMSSNTTLDMAGGSAHTGLAGRCGRQSDRRSGAARQAAP